MLNFGSTRIGSARGEHLIPLERRHDRIPRRTDKTFLLRQNLIRSSKWWVRSSEQWTGIFKAYLVEAKWYSSGYTPTLEEFLQTSWISVGSLGIQMYAFALLGQGLAPESCDFVEKVSDILPLAGMMVRFPDDL
ncbi:Geraniol synthase, chloroplastic [Cinnamomum micranthum f. kanehirae]|uniref:Geraniol synthase, chloroplastic n=1 Tax=Cinnamomum micranthum f. kanehirae TaxID=337451 RepID=A0A3S3P0Q1_9MAGN|nr:Geraniol synthase, chloroplastic [Cinnamomum micranthum f. kanehirae]